MAAEIQSTQDKYTRADKTNEPPQIKENEVRITTRGRVKKYVDYATRLFQGAQDSEENTGGDSEEKRGPTKEFDTIVLKATGKAINKAVTTAEVVKRTIGDLHQETTLETLEIVDVWEPKEEGLQKVETTRRVASISIKLSRKIEDVDVKSAGYQKPIAQETGFNLGYRGNGRRGGGRGGGPGGYQRNRGGYRGGYRGNNRRNFGGDRRRNDRRNNPQNRNFNRNNNYGGNPRGGPRGGPGGYNNNNNNYGGNRNFNQGNNNYGGNQNFNQGYRGGRGGPGGPQQRMGGGGPGGYNRQGNFGSPRRYPRNDGRRGRGGPRRGGYY